MAGPVSGGNMLAALYGFCILSLELTQRTRPRVPCIAFSRESASVVMRSSQRLVL
jgi:hypothetical protein